MKSFLKRHWLFLLLAFLSFLIHFAFLNYPAQVVFDEVHFGKFVSAYFTHEYYFDIHPPLGKLMIAGFAKIAGANPVFDFNHIGEQASAKMLAILRFLPAFFGAIFVLLFSWLAYLVSGNKKIALIAGFLILFDNALLVQSKFILVDIFLLFFEILTFCFFFLWQRQKSWNKKWFLYLFFTSISFGLTISIKWTGLAMIGIVGIILLAKLFSKKLTDYLEKTEIKIDKKSHAKIFKESAFGFFSIIILGYLIYLIPFIIHFNLLTKSGPGDAFMSQDFQQELLYGEKNIDKPLNFFLKFTELNKTMFSANASLTAQHPFGSKWYQWPFGKKPVYYWTSPSENKIADIYIAGNYLLWWTAFLGILGILGAIFFRQSRKKIEPIFYILILAYFANLLPFILINRVTFLYHYLPSVCFAILLLSLWLAKLWQNNKKILLAIMISIFLSFTILSPLSYGLPLPEKLNHIEIKLLTLF